jgi:hypothetical protein
MIKLAPAPNAAARTLRDGGLIGCGFIVLGLIALLLADERWSLTFALFFLIFGFLTALPTLIARGIRLERQSREPS